VLRGLDRTVIAWHTSGCWLPAGCACKQLRHCQFCPACAATCCCTAAQPKPCAGVSSTALWVLACLNLHGSPWRRVLVFWCCCYSGQRCKAIGTCGAGPFLCPQCMLQLSFGLAGLVQLRMCLMSPRSPALGVSGGGSLAVAVLPGGCSVTAAVPRP
jgi:hypothetical protein